MGFGLIILVKFRSWNGISFSKIKSFEQINLIQRHNFSNYREFILFFKILNSLEILFKSFFDIFRLFFDSSDSFMNFNVSFKLLKNIEIIINIYLYIYITENVLRKFIQNVLMQN